MLVQSSQTPSVPLDKRIVRQWTERTLQRPDGSSYVIPGGSIEWWLIQDSNNNTLWKPFHIDQHGTPNAVGWANLPGSQDVFIGCPVFEALYHGNRGNGKTLTLLMDFCQEVGKGWGVNWRGILFRQSYGDLDDVVQKIKAEILPKFPGSVFLSSKAEYRLEFQTGETLLLRHLIDEAGYDSYHGHQYPWIGFEELTQWVDDKPYRKMFSCCRPTTSGIPCRVRATTNPSGAGHAWVKKRFKLTNKRDSGKIIVEGGMKRVAIKGHLSENFVLLHSQPNYPQIIAQAATSPAQLDAWLNGSWDINDGGMFDDLFDSAIHVVPNFPAKIIPKSWRIVRSYDHGQAHPFSVGWWAESNGEPLKYKGHEYGTKRGDRIRLMEWYGTSGEPNTGLRMRASRIAEGILDREEDYGIRGRVQSGPADTEIWSKDSRGTGRCPHDDMNDRGVFFVKADKTPGSRKRGWQMIRSLMEGSKPNKEGTRESAGIFICEGCKYWLDLVPTMPRDKKDPDDCPEKYEDHIGDETRYFCNYGIPSATGSEF